MVDLTTLDLFELQLLQRFLMGQLTEVQDELASRKQERHLWLTEMNGARCVYCSHWKHNSTSKICYGYNHRGQKNSSVSPDRIKKAKRERKQHG